MSDQSEDGPAGSVGDPPLSPTGLVGVYRDADVAERLAAELAKLDGLEDEQVHLGRESDVVTSLQAEMGEEMGTAFIVPQMGMVFQKKAVKDLLFLMPIFAVVGALIGLPFAFLDFAGLTMRTRLILFPIVGVLFSTTVAAIAIPALASPDPYKRSAAHRGVVVRVDSWSPEQEELMSTYDPIRLDRIGAGDVPVETVVTEEREEPGGAIEDLGRTLAHETTAPPAERDR